MNKRKKLTVFMSILILISFLPGIVGAQEPTARLWVNGKYVKTDVPPIIRNDRTLVPIRFVSENLGYNVYWDEFQRAVYVHRWAPTRDRLERTFVLEIGVPVITELDVDDLNHVVRNYRSGNRDGMVKIADRRKIDVSPIIYKDRTMVPLRAIAENMGMNVDWDQENRTAVIGDGYIPPEQSENFPAEDTFQKVEVSSVMNGNLIDVIIDGEEYPVRLLSVDTPSRQLWEWEKYGEEIAEYVASEILGKTVYLEKDVSDVNEIGHLLRYVWLERPATNTPTKEEIETLCFNSRLLERGYGRLTPDSKNKKYLEIFREKEQIAQEHHTGIWKDAK